MPDPAPVRVFISYPREEEAFVSRLERDLRSLGLHPWVDRSKLEGGQRFGEAIEAAIDRCTLVLVVLAPATSRSRWVRAECNYALEAEKPVIPLKVTSCRPPIELAGIQHVSFIESYDQGMAVLAGSMAHILIATSGAIPAARDAPDRDVATQNDRGRWPSLQNAAVRSSPADSSPPAERVQVAPAPAPAPPLQPEASVPAESGAAAPPIESSQDVAGHDSETPVNYLPDATSDETSTAAGATNLSSDHQPQGNRARDPLPDSPPTVEFLRGRRLSDTEPMPAVTSTPVPPTPSSAPTPPASTIPPVRSRSRNSQGGGLLSHHTGGESPHRAPSGPRNGSGHSGNGGHLPSGSGLPSRARDRRGRRFDDRDYARGGGSRSRWDDDEWDAGWETGTWETGWATGFGPSLDYGRESGEGADSGFWSPGRDDWDDDPLTDSLSTLARLGAVHAPMSRRARLRLLLRTRPAAAAMVASLLLGLMLSGTAVLGGFDVFVEAGGFGILRLAHQEPISPGLTGILSVVVIGVAAAGALVAVLSLVILLHGGYGPFLKALLRGKRTGSKRAQRAAKGDLVAASANTSSNR